MKFEDAFEQYKIYAKSQHKKQGFITHISNFNSRIIPYFKEKDIHKIKSLDIIDWQNKINELKFKYSYKSKLFINLNSFMQYCCDFHNLKENPMTVVKNFKKDLIPKKYDFYNLKEFNQFIKGFTKEDFIYKIFFEFMFFCGTRPGETFALKFSNLEKDYIKITSNLTTKGGRELDSPKNIYSFRKFKIDNILKKELLELKKFYIEKYKMCDYDYYIFGGIKPLAPTTVNTHKKKACKKANIRPITLHQFRHSHATFLLQNNIMINEVSRRLGHNRTSTTLDIYAHTDATQEKRVLKTLNSHRNNFFITHISNFKKVISHIKT